MRSSNEDLFPRPGSVARAAIDGAGHQTGGVRRRPVATIPVCDRSQPLRASFAQERLWFLETLQSEAPAYNLIKAFRLVGLLDLAVLHRALDEIVRRHEALRTTFAERDGHLVQMVGAPREVALSVVDLRGVPTDQHDTEIMRRGAEVGFLRFDLARDLMLRATLLRFGPDHHVLFLVVHHIATDGWSGNLLRKELSALYSAYSAGLPSPLPELQIQYADFAQWQREMLRGENFDRLVSYWKARLSGIPEQINLPLDRPRPEVMSYRGARVAFSLSASLTTELRALSRRGGATLFMTLLGAWQILLSRHSGQEDVVVGSPIAGRNRAELEGLIGYFANTLPLRTDLTGDPTFRELLRRVREGALEAYTHQDLPFERLVEELEPQRFLSHSPLFQVMLALQQTQRTVSEAANLAITDLEVAAKTSKFDLTLSLRESADGLRGLLEYSTDLFDAATIERLLGHFQVLLEGIAAEPDRPIGKLPLLTAAERQKLLVDWNQIDSGHPPDACLHELFEAQVHRAPDSIAVVYEEHELTYRELNVRANRLAHHLIGMGVGPETLVGLCVDRSLDMIVGLMGILKAGGAYVPLDPEYPVARLNQMLADAAPHVVLTTAGLRDCLPQSTSALVLDAPQTLVALERCPTHNPTAEERKARLEPDHPAYVIYTSGSTGTPKGVVVTHRNVVRLFSTTRHWFNFGAHDVWTLFHSITFDFSVWELWGALIHGGLLVVVSRMTARSPEELLELLVRHQVTVLNQTPSAFNQLIEADCARPDLGDRLSLRRIIFGGERLAFSRLEKWYCRHADDSPVLVNMYGITETTVHVTYLALSEELARSAGGSLIGRKLPDLRVYVLDTHGEPVPVGVAGEMFVAGAGLARGYLNQPELTADRFVPDVFNAESGARMYRTGDLARWRADGSLEFLGRADQQVKVRGFRIELGEIEAALTAQPGIAQAAVVARDDGPGGTALIAWVVPIPGVECDLRNVRLALGRRLPDFMMPAAIGLLDALPLTTNGKLDRQALPTCEIDRVDTSPTHVPPRTPVEELLAGIWSSVLRVEQVGVHDNFFALGGHSLLAAQLIARVRDAFAVEVPVRSLFEAPTVAELALRIESARPAAVMDPPLAVPRMPRSGDFPLSFAQERLLFFERFEGPSAIYNVPWVVRLTGRLNGPALERSLREIVSRHEALRTCFVSRNGELQPVVLDPADFDFKTIDLAHLPEAEREPEARRLAADETSRPFDLSRDVLLRVRLLQLDDQQQWLVMTMHHIASDGWSLGVFSRELSALYAAYSHNQPSPLPELPIQYVDYALWQRDRLKGESLDRQLTYWKQQLSGAPGLLELPTDLPRPAAQTYRGARQAFELDLNLCQALHELSRREGVTPFMLLLAAFQVLLARYSGQDDVSVGSPIAGRHRTDLEGLIGLFVNTLVLRTNLSGNPTFRELLRRVREVTLGAYAHQDLPFETLVAEMCPERSLSHSPLFQVMFVVQNAPASPLALSDVVVEQIRLDNSTTKFDLTLALEAAPAGMQGRLAYNTDLFRAETIARMVGHFRVLLEGIVANPGARIGDLALLTEDEREQLLVEWSGTDTDYPREACIYELFEAQVDRAPDAVAVVFRNQETTYRELNARADRLAHYLMGQGVGPESVVGICMERSAEMIVGLLGILKAGGAYLPLDPEYPTARLAQIVDDATPVAVVSTQALRQQLPAATPVVCLDAAEIMTALSQTPLQNPGGRRSRSRHDHAAYVISTSGSTGEPKGVVVEQSSVVRLVINTNYIEITPADCIAQGSTVCFDAATFEIWGALLNGAKLAILDRDLMLDPARLAVALRERKITVSFLTTQLFNQIVADAPGAFSGLRCLLTGGEQPDPARFRELLSRQGPQELLHVYGPTETTTFASFYRVRDVAPDATTIPIGRALANDRLYVLNQARLPVPVGVPGELYIGGGGVARGYLKRPELTAEKFLTDPFSNRPGARMYRTGDLVRWLPDGNLEFLGRLDHQVKLRGFRIEPAEIEGVLRAQPGVAQAAVIAREDGAEGKRLVAYVVPLPGAMIDTDALRERLSQRLPVYMVPTAFVVLEALPLTVSGKLDRKALPAPRRQERIYRAPRTPQEQILCELFAEVLALERVGIDDEFFALGGHSLLAMRLVSRVRTTLGVEMPIRAVFEAPTAEGIAARLHESPTARVPLVGQRRPERLPLSYAQQRLWFIDRMQGSSTEYNMTLALRFRGELDRKALLLAINAIVARHESLRTHFAEINGEPMQVIVPELPIDVPVEDLREFDEPTRQAALAAAQRRERDEPFDLGRGPLLRMKLLRLADDEHVVLRTCHHIVSDGWSVGVFNRELTELYAAFRAGCDRPLAPLPVQYADFALWQRGWLDEKGLAHSLDYWKAQLSGLPERLALPADRPRPALQTYAAKVCRVNLPAEQAAALVRLGRESGGTLYMTLLSAFAALLQRYSGQDDIVVGSPVANRQDPQLEQLIGFFVNSLVIRVRVTPESSFRSLLADVRRTTLEAYEHQDLPFERLVEELSPERSLSYTPLFQVVFSLQNAAGADTRLEGLEVERVPGDDVRVRFDLEVQAFERNGRIELSWIYNRDLFDGWRIEQMARHYVTLLEAASAEPDIPLHLLDILSPQERQRLLEEFNATSGPPPETTLPDLFENQVAQCPNAVAVTFGEESLSYSQLNARANRLAHHLISLGVGPECLVGISLERSIDMVVALLGILKAGGAYVPIDVDLPKMRRDNLLAEAGLRHMVTTEAFRSLFDRQVEQIVTCGARQFANQSPENPEFELRPDHPAYVNFTSGSTGHPKGVVVPHRAVVRLVREPNYVRLNSSTRLLQLAPLSFDAATFEIWGALLNGGSLVIMPPGLASPTEIGDVLTGQRVDTLWLTAGLFNQMVDLALPALSGVSQLLAGGDVLSVEHVQKAQRAHPKCQIINGYGPTENTTFSTCYRIPAQADFSQGVPIGTPVNHSRAYVLDRRLKPVPIGVTGELYVAGAGIALGYLNQPEWTAEKFIPDAFSNRPGARMYRTGDLVRWRADGVLQFEGRTDQQIKLRGFRIEPAEIEGALLAHPDVAQAAVIAREDGALGRRLVACVIPVPGAIPDVAHLRRYLAERLPDYMVPAAYVMLDALPLTANGKVDRQALSIHSAEPILAHSAPVDRLRPIEAQLLMIWEEILSTTSVHPDDNFFDLGGHSLLAVGLMSRIAQVMRHNLPVRALFEAPTVRQMAQLLRENPEARVWPTLIPIQPKGSRPPLICVAAPNVNALGFAFLARHLGHDQPVYGLQRQDSQNPDRFYTQADYEALAASSISALNEVWPEGPCLLCGFCEGTHIAFEMARQLSAAGREIGLLAMFDAWPLENTTSRIRHLLTRVYGRWKRRWQQGRLSNALPFLRRQLLRTNGSPRRQATESPDADGAPLNAAERARWNRWRERMWPGKDFIPPVFDGRITVFRIRRQPFWRVRDDSLGWRARAAQGVEIHEVPGEHHTILSEPHVQVLARKLTECISQVQ